MLECVSDLPENKIESVCCHLHHSFSRSAAFRYIHTVTTLPRETDNAEVLIHIYCFKYATLSHSACVRLGCNHNERWWCSVWIMNYASGVADSICGQRRQASGAGVDKCRSCGEGGGAASKWDCAVLKVMRRK